jgi:hypothetical protein
MADNAGEDAAVAIAAIRDRLAPAVAASGGGRAPETAALVAEKVDAQGRLCRDYERSVVIGGQTARASATVCRDGQGEWALAAATPQRASIAPVTSICPPPGTVVETSLGGYFRFTYGDGPRCWYRTRNGGIEARYGAFLGGDSTWLEQGGLNLRHLFPLEVGKQVSFIVEGVTADGYGASWDETYTVVGREQVKVKAGTFDTFVIEWEELGRRGSLWEATHKFWYAPAVGYIVKFRPAWHTRMKSWEATRVTLPTDPLTAAAPAGSAAGSGSSQPPSRPAR